MDLITHIWKHPLPYMDRRPLTYLVSPSPEVNSKKIDPSSFFAIPPPPCANIDRCKSPDDILAIFQAQSQAFDEFRNGDPKLIKWLRPVVNGLHAISTDTVASAGISIVSSNQSVFHWHSDLTVTSRHGPLQISFFLELVSFSP